MSQTWDARDKLAQEAVNAMTTKHTPGPWTIKHDDCHIYAPCGGHTGLIAGCGGHSCRRRDLLDEQRANAKLIAASPELLAACKQALGAFEHNWAINWDDLREAIKKAEGE